jgi:hypothetical protein
VSEIVWIEQSVREAREAAAPGRCNEFIRGYFGAVTFCGLRKGHGGQCGPAMPPLDGEDV